MKLPENLQQVADSRAPDVLLVPGGYFFNRLVPLPEEVAAEEFESLAELTLEECSPFPLEQLAWGFMVDEPRRELWVFAACRPRIGSSELDSWDEAEFVFPAFLPLLLAFPEPPKHLVWNSDAEVMVMEFAPGSRFPSKIRHRRRIDRTNEEDEAVEKPELDVLDTFLDSYGLDPDATPIYALESIPVSDDRQVSFEIKQLNTDDESVPTVGFPNAESPWWADLRFPEFIASEKRSRILQGNLWRSLHIASWAAVVLILLFLLTFMGNILVDRRQQTIANQEGSVLAVQHNDEFLRKLQQFSDRPLRPYEVIGMTNEYRPIKDIYYRSASVDSEQGVTIQGFAQDVGQVNDFNDRILASDSFNELEEANSNISRDQVEFTLRLEFTGKFDPAPEPVAMAEESATPANPEVEEVEQ